MMDGERAQIKMREKGFYWVFSDGRWVVAEWDGGYWMFPGDSVEQIGDGCMRINETRLMEPEDDEESNRLPIWDGKASGGGTFERGE